MKRLEEIFASGLLEDYVLGTLSKNETDLVNSWINEYPKVKAYIDSLEASLEKASVKNGIKPPKSTKLKVLRDLDPEYQKPSISSYLGFAAAFLIGILSMFGIHQYLEHRAETLSEQQLAQIKADCQQTKDELKSAEALLFFLTHEATQTTKLTSNNTELMVYHNGVAKQAKIRCHNLPLLGKNETFQMWADVEGKMINMGVFDGSNHSYQNLEFIDSAESFNVTIEPEGGSDHPTVSKIVVSQKV